MGTFTAEFVQTARILESDAFGTGGRTVVYRVNTLRVTGGSRRHEHERGVSASVSNLGVPLDPISDALSASVLWFEADNPLDIRLGASNSTMISGVRSMVIGATLSALFVTNPSSTVSAIMRVLVIGGASATASLPLA